MDVDQIGGRALCPACDAVHSYTEVKYPGGINDRGVWQVQCRGCTQQFLIKVRNPFESSAAFNVVANFDEGEDLPDLPVSGEGIIYTGLPSDYTPTFDYEATPLYLCATSGVNLEHAALEALTKEFSAISLRLAMAENYLLSGHLNVEQSVIHVAVRCACGKPHVATFYSELKIGADEEAVPSDLLLADVTGADLPGRLGGLVTKTEAMDLLAKLLARWHLLADRIVVAAPFVGHQFLNSEDKQRNWIWLLERLDPNYAVLITRAKTIKEFKKLEGLLPPFELLKRFGLENKIVAANTKLQASHAKFYAGVSGSNCEVFSGSANLVAGTSLENVSFACLSPTMWDQQYMSRLEVELPPARKRLATFVCTRRNEDGHWFCGPKTGSRIPDF